MNRTIFSLLSIIPIAGTLAAGAQAPTTAPGAPQTNSISESGRISRVVAGPGNRPEGLLLRNGTFVNLSPGLSQHLPSTLAKNSSVRVAGDVMTYNGSRTIEAHTVTIAGVNYNEAAGVAMPMGGPLGAAGSAPVPPPAPPTAGGPGGAPPPPPPCAAGGPPPTPHAGAAGPAAARNGALPPQPPPPPAGAASPGVQPPKPPRDGAVPPAAPPARNAPLPPSTN